MHELSIAQNIIDIVRAEMRRYDAKRLKAVRLEVGAMSSVAPDSLSFCFDAERIAKKGVTAVQINTDGACHLDANMVRQTFNTFNFREIDLLLVENVGNLVCPAEFNVGEDFKVMMLSVAEGDDKPSKYPLMFRESRVLLINKIDLLPYVDCSIDKMREDSLKINPDFEKLLKKETSHENQYHFKDCEPAFGCSARFSVSHRSAEWNFYR